MKYNIGDKVTVINCTDHRKTYNGETFTIESINPNGVVMRGEHYGVSGSCPYVFYTNELALVGSRSITINVYDNKTVAKLLYGDKVVKTAIAKCNPEDEFDFEVGAKIAFDRLFNNVKEVSRRAKVGEYVKVVDDSSSEFKLGEVVICVQLDSDECDKFEYLDGHDYWYMSQSSYVVLENYKPKNSKKPEERKEPKFKVGDKVEVTGNNGNGIHNHCKIGETVIVEAVDWNNNDKFYCYYCKWGDCHQYVAESNLKLAPKLYNGKVVCVETRARFLTEGKIYTFKDGFSVDDKGNRMPSSDAAKSFENLKTRYVSKFIEVVE